ncbi:heterokaryon incompatibility protein-domain-containing protein [Xylariaceae sp. FL1651]|nr:heterokaryon incompatibility protein-domain-containing protein [Xylariaceae sp. FL1651]
MDAPPDSSHATAAKHFCSWCTAWRTNSETDVVGYIGPSPQTAALESQKYEGWMQKLQSLTRQEEPKKIDKHSDLVNHRDTVEQAVETTSHTEEDAGETGGSDEENETDNEENECSHKGSKDSEDESENIDDPDAAARAALGLPPPRRLPDLLESASTCFLCNKIWVGFNTWATAKYGSPSHLDMSTSRVEVEGLWPKRLPEEGEQWAEYSGYGDDGIHGRLCLLEFRVTVREPGNTGSWVGPCLILQKSYELAPSVADIFNGAGLSDECNALVWPDNEPYVARKRPLVADMRLFQKWKWLCDAAHDDRCRPGRIPSGERRRLAAIRLIDVETGSLVETENVDNVSWVALSYVWGSTPFRTLTGDTLEGFKEAGALIASWVPNTIADAIQVTKGLGERYLWTDSLCIIQDSDADKTRFIPYMDVIFGRACVTIINAFGDNAFSGLPGVRPSTRFQAEEPFELDGTWFMQSHREIGEANEIVGDSKWFTRGWTFQEAILSPRWLVFTSEQVYWECRQGTWREDACWELPQYREKKQTVIHEPAFDNGAFQDLWTVSSVQKVDETYQCLVHSFAKRDLTRESDGLDAFRGILRAITQVSEIEFIWGLPRMFLGVAITWPCARERPKRRTALCHVELTEGGETVKSHFPSWSWVGWVGRVYFHELFGPLDGEHAGLKFYHLENTGTGETFTIRPIPQNKTFRVDGYEYSKPFQGTNPSWRGDTDAIIKPSDVPVGLLRPELRHTVLAFWTSCVELSLQYDKNARGKNKWDTENFSLWVDDTMKLDVMWDQYPPVAEDVGHDGNGGIQRSLIKCIVVGRDSLERRRERGQLRVLLVARHPSGGLSREGQVAIWEEDWNQLENRRWEVVFLI